MTISTEVRRAGPFTGTGLVATYAFAFKIFATSDVVATQTDLTGTETTLVLNTDYTVSMNPDQDNDPGGDVVLTANLTTDYLLTITSDVPELQSVELTNLGGFYPTVLNPLFDKLVILCQQISEKLGRQITLPVSSAYTDITIPDPQANYYLQWKSDLSGLQNVSAMSITAHTVSAFGQTLIDDADAAAARITLGNVATFTGAETLTNKTLTTPTINTPTIASPVLNGSISGTALGRGALVYKSANESVPSSTYTHLSFDTKTLGYDTDGIHDNAVNNKRLTVPAGVSLVRLLAHTVWSSVTSCLTFGCLISKNDETTSPNLAYPGCASNFIQLTTDGYAFSQNVTTAVISVVPGDYFTLCVYHDDTVARDIIAQTGLSPVNSFTWFAMEIIK